MKPLSINSLPQLHFIELHHIWEVVSIPMLYSLESEQNAIVAEFEGTKKREREREREMLDNVELTKCQKRSSLKFILG